MKGSPDPTGNADGGTGIFGWLRENGFTYLYDAPNHFMPGFLLVNAYISSTKSGISGESWEALWNRGVDFVGRSDYKTNVGVWCVTDETKTAVGGQ